MLALIRTKTILQFFTLIQICTSIISAQTPAPKGHWKFDDSINPLKAQTGRDLTLRGIHTYTNGPSPDNGAIRIGTGSYYEIDHGIAPNGGGTMVNEYTIMIDLRLTDMNVWRSIFQTDPKNKNDGECFIKPSGYIGIQATGYSTFAVKAKEWYRLVISVKNGVHYRYYIDGHLINNGFYQTLDKRFALDNLLLLFADEDGEDGEIECAEAAIWDFALTTDQVKSLGDYGHAPKQHMLVPYLQTPSPNSIYVSWHDSLKTSTRVEYGTSNALGQFEDGSYEVISHPYIWHTVKLKGLSPNTEYFYRLISGSGISQVYSFRTQPDENYSGKIRFLLLSDTHANDTTMTMKVIRAARKKIERLYGNDIHNQINLILHSGDLVVSSTDVTQWTEQYFAPMSVISPNIPALTVAGNHEGEDINYYRYVKYDEITGGNGSDQSQERYWSYRIRNTGIIGLNSNLTGTRASEQLIWLDNELKRLESDSGIDFIIVVVHHIAYSELWGNGMDDQAVVYVRNQILPVLKKYSKVTQLSHGHTHGFERSTVESESPLQKWDFRVVCGGGGGGPLDYWGSYINNDYEMIHIALDHYNFQIIEIDIAEKTYNSSMYSLGNLLRPIDSELLDSWYRKINQPAPSKPIVNNPVFDKERVIFTSSGINSDSLMSVKISISESPGFGNTVIDTVIHWKNIYGTDASYNPVDLNKGIDLTSITISNSKFVHEKNYYYRVRYRDHNLRWSEWSDAKGFHLPSDIEDNTSISRYDLRQNYPNPFNAETKIVYQIPRSGFVTLRVYDLLGKEIATLVNTEKKAGRYEAVFESGSLSSGVYFYKLDISDISDRSGNNFTQTRKLILIK